MTTSVINSDNGAISGTSGIKTTGGDDGALNIQSNGTNMLELSAGVAAVKGTSSGGAALRLYEDTDNGTNYVGLVAPASVASNLSLTLPSADGTSGQVLQTNGSGTLSFADAGGGAWNLISTVNASSSASVEFTNLNTTYDCYVVNISNVLPSASGDGFALQFSTNNGSSYITTLIYYYNRAVTRAGISTVSNGPSTGAESITLCSSIDNTASGGGASVQVMLFSPYTSQQPQVLATSVENGGGTSTFKVNLISGTAATSLVNAIRFICPSGNITSGTFSLYGISK